MIYQLSASQESDFLRMPETGMGYQVVEARKSGYYVTDRFLVLNSEIVIDIDGSEPENVRKVIREGIFSMKQRIGQIQLMSVNVLNEDQFKNAFREAKPKSQSGAIDNPLEYASGKEIFVRLSAFDYDRRVDKINKCLLPGSFTTTADDYLACKNTNDDPVERYALPYNDEIKHAFHFLPKSHDSLQKGVVQPAYGKRGGGKEAYFAKGTSRDTFLRQTLY